MKGKEKEKMVRSLRTFGVLLLGLGLLGFMGGSSPLMADENDPPHQTMMTADRGPHISDCAVCHDAASAASYSGGATYNDGDYVTYGGSIYKCINNGTAGVAPDDAVNGYDGSGAPYWEKSWDDVNWDVCKTCHSPDGAYDGVNDFSLGLDGQPGKAGVDDDGNGSVDDSPEVGWPSTDDTSVGAKYNWEYRQSPTDASQSWIYDDPCAADPYAGGTTYNDGDYVEYQDHLFKCSHDSTGPGTAPDDATHGYDSDDPYWDLRTFGQLRNSKFKWCGTCHDQDATGANLVDDFEGYANDKSLRGAGWKGKKDALKPTLGSYLGGEDGEIINGISGQFMTVKVRWDDTTSQKALVQRTFDSPLDLSDRDYFCFYVKIRHNKRITKFQVRLQKSSAGTWCKSDWIRVKKHNVWHQIAVPRTDFNVTDWGLVDTIQFVFLEKNPDLLSNSTIIYLDEIGCDYTGPNVVGDDSTYGHYVTGHKMVCTHCHDSCSGHIDDRRAHIFNYIGNTWVSTKNPTNFRFYVDDSTTNFYYEDLEGGEVGFLDMELPIGDNTTYAGRRFALCFKCHPESAITTSITPGPFSDYEGDYDNGTTYDEGDSVQYDNHFFRCIQDGTTGVPPDDAIHGYAPDDPDDVPYWEPGSNFVDVDPPGLGTTEHNYHYYHVTGQMAGSPPWYMTCVRCHDPHGQTRGAMSRDGMEGFINFDTKGCEITDQADRHDPDINMGGARTLWSIRNDENTLCAQDQCHVVDMENTRQYKDVAPPHEDCADGQHNTYDNWYTYGSGFYKRTYVDPVINDCETLYCHATGKGHDTHVRDSCKGPPETQGEGNCAVCHGGDLYKIDDLVDAGTCDNCHSGGLLPVDYGSYNGRDFLTPANWADGVYDYDADPLELRVGNEEWCISCHDEVPANTKQNGSGVVDAPDVHLYYSSGHGYYNAVDDWASPTCKITGEKVECLNCHVASCDDPEYANNEHIDEEHRTYAFNSAYYASGQSGKEYARGYRLRYVDVLGNLEVPLMIPAEATQTFSVDFTDIKNKGFRLCFECHDSSKMLFDTIPGDSFATNYLYSPPDPPQQFSYDTPISNKNLHYRHLLPRLFRYWDSDWDYSTANDGATPGADSMITCSSCHNVHGAAGTVVDDGGSPYTCTNETMMRDGSLAKEDDLDPRKDGYGFSYVIKLNPPITAPTWDWFPPFGDAWVTSVNAQQYDGVGNYTSIGAILRNDLEVTKMCGGGGSGCHKDMIPENQADYDAAGASNYLEYYRLFDPNIDILFPLSPCP